MILIRCCDQSQADLKPAFRRLALYLSWHKQVENGSGMMHQRSKNFETKTKLVKFVEDQDARPLM
jgi:hypothetical protein